MSITICWKQYLAWRFPLILKDFIYLFEFFIEYAFIKNLNYIKWYRSLIKSVFKYSSTETLTLTNFKLLIYHPNTQLRKTLFWERLIIPVVTLTSFIPIVVHEHQSSSWLAGINLSQSGNSGQHVWTKGAIRHLFSMFFLTQLWNNKQLCWNPDAYKFAPAPRVNRLMIGGTRSQVWCHVQVHSFQDARLSFIPWMQNPWKYAYFVWRHAQFLMIQSIFRHRDQRIKPSRETPLQG